MARRRPPEDANTWHLKRSPHGVVRNRSGIAVAFYDRYSHSTGLAFDPANRREILQDAERWVREIRERRPRAAPAPGAPTLRSAWGEFDAAYISAGNERRQLEFDLTWKAWGQTDFVLTDDAIHRHTIERLAELRARYAPNTLATSTGRWHRFLRYCRDRGWLRVNPLDVVERPRIQRKEQEDLVTWTPRETVRAIQYFRERAATEHERVDAPSLRTSLEYANLIRVLYFSGLRLGEALALWWPEAVTDPRRQSQVLSSKLILRGTKTGDYELPLDPFPELRRAIDRQRAFQYRNGGRVFRWDGIRSPNTKMRECLRALRLDKGPNPWHAFRATAEARWRRLGIPETVVVKLARHDIGTYKRRYRTVPAAEEIGLEVMLALSDRRESVARISRVSDTD